MRILAKIALALTSFETRTAFSYQDTSQARYIKDSLSYRGASLWNFVNYNDKEASATISFNELMKRVSAEDYFIDLRSECTSASAISRRGSRILKWG